MRIVNCTKSQVCVKVADITTPYGSGNSDASQTCMVWSCASVQHSKTMVGKLVCVNIQVWILFHAAEDRPMC